MIEAYLIENVLSSLFDFLKKKILSSPLDQAKFDFLIQEENGQKVAIEVKGQLVTVKTLRNLIDAVKEYPDLKEIYLITPEEPSPESKKVFNQYFRPSKVKATWTGINNFIQLQNLDIELSGNLRETLQNLQVAAVTSKLEDYDKKNIGNNLNKESAKDHLKRNLAEIKDSRIGKTNAQLGLRRQFPYNVIAELETNPDELSARLHIGKKYEDAIIVLTDIKNFSSIVSASDPEELNELMSKYYTSAKKLVFKYNGILDKFIGDAVLAIFNYPQKDKLAFKNAIKFCSELILLGERILKEYQKNLDHEIETGTRIGIASGPIYALNIGSDEYEVTFIGDKINFAARLEKNCTVDGILMSNRFYNKLEANSHEFADIIKKTEKKLNPSDAKGQIGVMTAFQIDKGDIESLLK